MWPVFRKRYLEELAQAEAAAALEELYRVARTRKKVTLIFSSRNSDRNNAAILKELMEGMRKPPSGAGPAAAARGKARAVRSRG